MPRELKNRPKLNALIIIAGIALAFAIPIYGQLGIFETLASTFLVIDCVCWLVYLASFKK